MSEFIARALILTLTAVLFGIAGVNEGKHAACESIGLEWHKDKCVKVTREDVR